MKGKWFLVAIIIAGLIVAAYFISRKDSDVQTNNMSTATVEIATSTQPISTATSTASKKVPKQINPSPVWVQYLKAFSCVQVTLPFTTIVNSFRQEGMPVAVETQTAYRCNNGHTWVY